MVGFARLSSIRQDSVVDKVTDGSVTDCHVMNTRFPGDERIGVPALSPNFSEGTPAISIVYVGHAIGYC